MGCKLGFNEPQRHRERRGEKERERGRRERERLGFLGFEQGK
jgi:hypothetical protein